MGLTPFACIPKQNDMHHFVRVVYPDGRIENLSRSCSVHEILQGNPDYFVCGSTANTVTSRMGTHEHLEKGFTYFVFADPNAAQPLPDFQAKRTGYRVTVASWRISRISQRSSRHGIQARDTRSPNSKVFDFHSATIQVEGMKVGMQVEGMKGGLHHPRHHLAPAKHLRLVFFRQCLQSLRLPRNFGEQVVATDESLPSPADVDLVNSLLKSAARSELGLYVSRRQEFYLRRARKRRKTLWKPVLQSISETTPVVEFLPPTAQVPSSPEPESKRFSPPRPAKSISPPRQRGPPRNISPPRQVHVSVSAQPPRNPPPPQRQHPQRKPVNQRSLYMA